MQKTLIPLLFLSLSLAARAQQADTARQEVLLETTLGNIRAALYNETPQHRDNFLRLVRSGYYDGCLWHRVIRDFMIQTGDSTTRHAAPSPAPAGDYCPEYTVPAEIVFPRYFHKRGALAAAREGDSENPKRASSSAQFYIVWGNTFARAALDRILARVQAATDTTVTFTPGQRRTYWELGGTPHLDAQYTVFGEVTEGLDAVDRLQSVATDPADRPVEDIRIIRATVVER